MASGDRLKTQGMHSPDRRVTADGRGLLQPASLPDPQGILAALRMIGTFAHLAPTGLGPAIDDTNRLRAKFFLHTIVCDAVQPAAHAPASQT